MLALMLFAAAAGCAGHATFPEPDVMDVTLPVPTDRVKSAVEDVLTEGGYQVLQESSGNLTTGMRREMGGPWDSLLRWRFGVGKSRVEARIVPQDQDNSTTRLRIQVFHRGKDGLFDSWENAETPLPQSAENQIRLIKNALRLL
jgi:hypothetical protein